MSEKKTLLPGERTRQWVQSQSVPDWERNDALRQQAKDERRRQLGHVVFEQPSAETYELSEAEAQIEDGETGEAFEEAQQAVEEAIERVSREENISDPNVALARAQQKYPTAFEQFSRVAHSETVHRDLQIKQAMRDGLTYGEAARSVDGTREPLRLTARAAEQDVDQLVKAHMSEHGVGYSAALDAVAAKHPDLVSRALRGGM